MLNQTKLLLLPSFLFVFCGMSCTKTVTNSSGGAANAYASGSTAIGGASSTNTTTTVSPEVTVSPDVNLAQ